MRKLSFGSAEYWGQMIGSPKDVAECVSLFETKDKAKNDKAVDMAVRFAHTDSMEFPYLLLTLSWSKWHIYALIAMCERMLPGRPDGIKSQFIKTGPGGFYRDDGVEELAKDLLAIWEERSKSKVTFPFKYDDDVTENYGREGSGDRAKQEVQELLAKIHAEKDSPTDLFNAK